LRLNLLEWGLQLLETVRRPLVFAIWPKPPDEKGSWGTFMSTGNAIGFCFLLALGVRRQPHPPDEIPESLVRSQRIKSRIDIQKRSKRSPFFIVAL